MALIASFTLSLTIARLAVASPVAEAHPALITPSPVLHRRDYAANFVGYALWDNGDTSTYTCGSPFTYTYESGYAGCCTDATYCTLSRYCDGATLNFEGGSSSICPSYCVTQSVFYSTDDAYPASIVQCDETSYDLTILRTSSLESDTPGAVTILVTVTPTSRPARSTEPITSDSSSATSSSTSTPVVPTAPLPAQTSPAPKKSIAPIVGGAVGGAVVLIALIGIGLFLFFRKRSQNSTTPAPGGFGDQPTMQSSPPSNFNPYSPQPSMAQTYPSPVSSPGMTPVSPYQPLAPTHPPYSPPPVYGNEKSASVTMAAMPTPHSEYEYRLPEHTAEVHGISAQAPMSSPPAGTQVPRNGATELA